MRDIGKNIRELRLKQNMTQDALAEALFVTRQTVSNYETGKSRPDIDMLVKMSEVLDCDVSTLLYGLPKPENRNKDVRAFFAGLALSIATGLPVLLMTIIEKELRNPGYGMGVLRWFVSPLFLLLFGWTLMQGIGLITNSKPLKAKWTKYIYWLVLALMLFYFALQLSEAVHEIRGHFVGLYVAKLVPPYHWSSSFRYNPAWLSFLSGRIFMINLHNKWLFFAAGILLWLFRGEKPNKKYRLYALGAALLLSLVIYLMADSEFVLGVENPEELGKVPYGIQVEQWTE